MKWNGQDDGKRLKYAENVWSDQELTNLVSKSFVSLFLIIKKRDRQEEGKDFH